MSGVRAFRPGDEEALAAVCLATADSGADAAGLIDDAMWADVFLLPYLARHPDLAFVAEDAAGRPAGYVIATDDTVAFDDWFVRDWWAARRDRYGAPDAPERQRALLADADARGTGGEEFRRTHPAHLHIDLLPSLQGRGTGRALIDTLIGALRARGIAGLHLVAGADNAGALAFYDRLGFTRVASPPGAQAFIRPL